jgi:AraC-like DNA-binding protein
MIEALQVVLVEEGRGQLELRRGRPITIPEGTAFVLLPGAWHRYRPEPSCGWTESWIEVQGALVQRLVARGIFSQAGAVKTAAAEVSEALAAVHALAREPAPGSDPLLLSRAFAVLAAWSSLGLDRGNPGNLQLAVREAERQLAAHHTQSINIEALARGLGVSYSHFRRAFRAHTGYAPWQYVLHLRLTQARRILVSSNATLDAIAAGLGFSSGFHLSAAFKRAFGTSPNAWRRRMRGGYPEALATGNRKISAALI